MCTITIQDTPCTGAVSMNFQSYIFEVNNNIKEKKHTQVPFYIMYAKVTTHKHTMTKGV